MKDNALIPDFIFESSWEVCNKVGGIYTVLSTRAKTMQSFMKGNLIFIGPDVWKGKENPLFQEDEELWADWRKQSSQKGLLVRCGKWNIPGNPYAVLVNFESYYPICNDIFAAAWNDFGVDSLHGYGDYHEASMFSFAAGLVVESYYHYYLKDTKNVVYQAHEWMTGLGALYLRKNLPQIATIFTTHATTIGRSIAGNQKPLYDYLWAYNGTQMSKELNVEAKHSIERQTAHNVDCFTTVSDVTARECQELLDKPCDVVLMNGFEADFVPNSKEFDAKRAEARKRILKVANALTGCEYPDDTIIVATSGRYEFKNKGIDVFLESMNRSRFDETLNRQVLALVQVPAWVGEPRADLQERLASETVFSEALPFPVHTHQQFNFNDDNVLNTLRRFDMMNRPEDRVHLIFVPCYLNGTDGIFNMNYYDLLIGDDLAVYPSYYEPWGYTPLEAVAFHVPCVTTTLSGFGEWVNHEVGKQSQIKDGVEVIFRNDYNYSDVADAISRVLSEFSAMKADEVTEVRKKAFALSEKALWKHFIAQYKKAYNVAIHNMQNRINKK